MTFTTRTILASIFATSALACGASDGGDTTPANHAIPDFHHADREKTPASVAEKEDFTTSDGRTRLHPEDVVFFEFDSDQLTPSATGYLETAARWLIEHPSRQVMIEGHTDPTGPAAYNADLAKRRAESVRAFLESKGVAGARISIVSLGESRAVYKQDDMNRRTVVYALD